MVTEREPILTRLLARECGLSELTAQLLVNRGIYTVEEALLFLNGGPGDLWSPYRLRDMDRATARIRAALGNGEKILVYGDYDVDGMTAVALLVGALRALGGRVIYHVPDREDGYGLHVPVLEQAAADGVGLVVTVDCGITAVAEVEHARALGLDVVVTDHHEPQGDLPPGPVLNPKRRDCPYPYKNLAGVGVALKLAQALLGETPPTFLALACLGTVADVMPLTGENRILVRHGLPLLPNHPGLTVLLGSRAAAGDLSIRDVVFGIAPALNAPGRLGRAELGVELLLAQDPETARVLAAELTALNEQRKYLEEKVLAEALAELGGMSALPEVVVIAGEGWSPGVVGIVASRLAGRLERPVALIAVEGDEGRGSARSPAHFDLVAALGTCRGLLTRFGGHRQAAGFTLPAAAIPRFVEAINDYARSLPDRDPVREAKIDAVVNLEDLSASLLREIESLEPWGVGNEPPLLAATGLRTVHCREVGRNGEHLKLSFRQGKTLIGGIGFNLAGARAGIESSPYVDLVFMPYLNRWNGREMPEVKVVDWKPGTNGGPAAETAAALGDVVPDQEPEDPCLLPPALARALRAEPPEEPRGGKRCRRVYDLRYIPFGVVVTRHFLQDGEPTLVAVPNPEMVSEMAAALRLALPECRVVWLTPGAGPREREAVLAQFGAGAADILVGVPPDGCGLRPARVVVFGLMYDWSDWKALAHCGAELVLAFSRYSRERNRRHLRSLAPSRNCLLQLFRLLGVSGPAVSDPQALVDGMRRRGHPYFTATTLEVGLAILEELGLVVRRGDRVERSPVNGRKRLRESPTFRRVHKIKRKAWQCQQFLLRASRADLARLFECDIILMGDDAHGY